MALFGEDYCLRWLCLGRTTEFYFLDDVINDEKGADIARKYVGR